MMLTRGCCPQASLHRPGTGPLGGSSISTPAATCRGPSRLIYPRVQTQGRCGRGSDQEHESACTRRPPPGRGRATDGGAINHITAPRARAIILDGADGGLAVARALLRRGVPVTVIAVPSYRWVTRARGVDGRLATTSDEWVGELDELASQGPGVLIPASDRAVEFVSKQREQIPPALRSFEGPDSAHLKLMDKASLYSLAAEAGVRAPVVRASPQSRRDRRRGGARRLSVAAEAGALARVPRSVRRPAQHPRSRSGRAPGRCRPGARRGARVARDRVRPGTRDQPRGRGDRAACGRLARARLHAAQAAAVPAVLRRRLGAGDRAGAGGDRHGPAAARHRGLRRHLQPGGQAARRDGRARPDGDQRPDPPEHRPRGGRRGRCVMAHLRNARGHPAPSPSGHSATACAWSSPASRCGRRSRTSGRGTCRCARSWARTEACAT